MEKNSLHAQTYKFRKPRIKKDSLEFKIPFTFSNTEILKKRSKKFFLFRSKSLGEHLKNSDVNLTASEYIGISMRSSFIAFVILLAIFTSILFLLRVNYFYFYGFGVALLFSFFLLFSQLNYPKIYSFRKALNIEKNLIPALQDILVQLESGVPIFQIIANIATSDYSGVSKEFGKAVNAINSGTPQIDALEDLIKRNSSVYFKRVLWQISNSLRSGSDMAIVVKDSIDNLNKEQAIQIQSYSSKLNPLIMFYMLIAVILPSLGLTFLTIISSMLGLSGSMIKLMYIAVFIFVVLIQIMFLGMIKTRRPSLL